MSDHIGLFLNLKHCIIEANDKLDDILVIYAIFHSLPHTNIWDVIRCNLLDKEKRLTLDILTAELISVHNYSECDHLADKKEKMLKSEQIALFTKSFCLPLFSSVLNSFCCMKSMISMRPFFNSSTQMQRSIC